MICFQISIFEPLETTYVLILPYEFPLWFAFKLVSLNHWKQQFDLLKTTEEVVICFQISIFEPLETTTIIFINTTRRLWFAFKLVSLNHWKQRPRCRWCGWDVVICFQISIFEPLETTLAIHHLLPSVLWFAFKLVSLNHWKQHNYKQKEVTNSCDLLSN